MSTTGMRIDSAPASAGTISAGELFGQQHERLQLRWIAGAEGASRRLEAGDTVARRPSLAGYLNAIYPNKVQILGTEELSWLDGLDSRQRWETIHKIVHFSPLALVISKDQSCPEDLRIAAEESGTPLWSSPKRGHELLNHLQYHLVRTLAPRVTLHGVFMEIYSIGVLVTGDSGSGKSELALELVTRGHRLVADDAPEFTQIAPDVLDGTCPELRAGAPCLSRRDGASPRRADRRGERRAHARSRAADRPCNGGRARRRERGRAHRRVAVDGVTRAYVTGASATPARRASPSSSRRSPARRH